MLNKIFSCAASAAVLFSSAAIACQTAANPDPRQTCSGDIGDIAAGSSWVRYALINTGAPHDNPDNCTRTGHYVLEKSNPNFEGMHSLILYAMASGKKIRFYMDGCFDLGNTYPKIKNMWVLPE